MDKEKLLTELQEKFLTYDDHSLQVAFACAIFQNGKYEFKGNSDFLVRTHMFWSPLMKWEDSTIFPEELREFFSGWEMTDITKIDFGMLHVRFSKNGVGLRIGLSYNPQTNGILFNILCDVTDRWEILSKQILPNIVEEYTKIL